MANNIIEDNIMENIIIKGNIMMGCTHTLIVMDILSMIIYTVNSDIFCKDPGGYLQNRSGGISVQNRSGGISVQNRSGGISTE